MSLQTVRRLGASLIALGLSAAATADAEHGEYPHARGAITHAPIGVMGDHMHVKGEMMFSYRAMRMEMDGMRAGEDDVDPREVTGRMGMPGDYMVSPVNMTMDMHMFGLMYAPSDDVTLMVMAPWIELEMDHVTRMGAEFTTETSGLGDVKLGALLRLADYEKNGVHSRWHVTTGFSAPTGSLDEEDDTPAGRAQLPYPMQLGSGTWDFRPALTWQGYKQRWNFGAQLSAVLPLEARNDEGYRLGNRYELTQWLAWSLNDSFSFSARLISSHWSGIVGERDDLNPGMVSTADTSNSGGQRVDAALGVNYMVRSGALKGNRLALEAQGPLHQDLDGVQLETDWTVTLGWQLAIQ